MDNGSWLGLFIPLPLILLLAGVVAVIALIGVAFILNQIVGYLSRASVREFVNARSALTMTLVHGGWRKHRQSLPPRRRITRDARHDSGVRCA